MDDLLTVQEVANRLNILAVDVRRLLTDKILPAIQTEGGQWRISARELQAYLDATEKLTRATPKGK